MLLNKKEKNKSKNKSKLQLKRRRKSKGKQFSKFLSNTHKIQNQNMEYRITLKKSNRI
jgi:hypothetical protein